MDPGTFEYAGEGSARDRFRSAAMHNTVCVDGLPQSEPSGPFAWRILAQGKMERWILGHSFDLFMGSHDGYRRLTEPVVHRRWVLALKSGLFLVRDVVEGEGKHQLDVHWHLASEAQLVADQLFRVKGASHGLAILPAEGHGWAQVLRKDVCSPVYGRKQPLTVLSFETLTKLPAEFITLLVPLEEVHRVPGKLVRLETQDAPSVSALRYESGPKVYLFFFADQRKPWKAGAVSSDAEFVCQRRVTGSNDCEVILCNGSYIEIENRQVLACERFVSWCELKVCDGVRKIFCSDPQAVEENQVRGDASVEASPLTVSRDNP